LDLATHEVGSLPGRVEGKIAAGARHPLTSLDVRRRIAIAIVVLALLGAFVPVDGEIIERRFSTTLYPGIQQAVTPVSNLVPFAIFDLLTVGGVVALAVALIRGARRARRERRLRPLLTVLGGIATAGAAVYLLFLVFWGLNYRRVPMTERLVMDRPAPDASAVFTLGSEAVRQMNALHADAHRLGWETDPRSNGGLLDSFASVQRRLSDAPLAVPGRLKRTLYGPYFRWTSVDGMVNPLALEVLANPDLLPYERPAVAAHEWAHLAGYADESEANFVGWLTCVGAGVPAQYSAWLNLYWQVSGDVAAADRARLRDALDPGPRTDVEAILERLRRGQLPLLRNASWRVYDHYLRANRVEEGVRSYGEVVTLLLRARFEDGWTPVRRTRSAPSR
jgi:hypothetical protein